MPKPNQRCRPIYELMTDLKKRGNKMLDVRMRKLVDLRRVSEDMTTSLRLRVRKEGKEKGG
jgi:hypothetical protein